jgi:transposase
VRGRTHIASGVSRPVVSAPEAVRSCHTSEKTKDGRAIVLRANGMQMTLIAAVLGISRQTAYEHLRRARETLRPVAPISGEPG